MVDHHCIVRLSNFSFQVDHVDKWILKLHATNCYTVSSAYYFLTELEHNRHQQHNNNNFLWLKAVPLKVLIFVWRLFLDRIPTRNKLFQRRVLLISDQGCVSNCGSNEDREHLFITCSFFGDLWNLVACWLGLSTIFYCQFFAHLHQFGGMRGFSKKMTESMNIIWLLAVWTIWKERNNRIFQRKEDNLLALGERVKLCALMASHMIVWTLFVSRRFDTPFAKAFSGDLYVYIYTPFWLLKRKTYIRHLVFIF